MAFTDPFIRRPVLATVVSLLIILLGAQAFSKLVIRQYPQMESALITVTTAYPGANAETIQGYITQPLQQSLASAEGIDYMTSSSQQNLSVISIYARIGADSDRLFTELLAKANAVKNQLPQEAEDPVLAKQAADSTALMYVSFYSDQLSNPQITDYLSRVIQPKLATLPGMAEAEILGNQVFAMRLWLDPVKMAAYGVTADDFSSAVRQYNFLAAAGEVKGQYVVTSINASTDLKSAEAFAAIPVKTVGDSRVLVGDIARVEMGSANYDSISSFDGIPSVYIAIKGTPSANPLDVIKHVRAAMPELEAQLPPNLKVAIAYDATEFIQASIDEVLKTLAEAVLIVIVVVFLFLGALRSVLIPVITIPLSMIGVLFFMQLMGYSINLLTLLAMVLAIGLVVDDAIVVTENIHRHIKEGRAPLDAALVGAREIASPVIAMTITLAAVYMPIGLMNGLTGALFKEFALTLAGAVLVSGVIALTLTPVMCAKLLPPGQSEGRMSLLAEGFFHRLSRLYQRGLVHSLRARGAVLAFGLLVLLSLPLLYGHADKELAPNEDQGNLLLAIKSPQHANLDFVERYAAQLSELLARIPETTSTWIINGTDGVAASFAGINFSEWGQRDRSAAQIQNELQQQVDAVEGNSIFVFQMPPLPASTGGLPVQLVIRSTEDYRALYQAMQDIKEQARASGLFAVVDSDLDFNNPVTEVRIDRSKANSLGIRLQDIASTLAVLVGENYTNRFGLQGRSYDVIPQTQAKQRLTPDALNGFYVSTDSGVQVPLSTVVSLHSDIQPNRLTQFNQQNSATFQGIPAPGVSLGEAVAFLANQSAQLPASFSHDWQSDSRQFIHEGNALMMTFLFAIIVIYMVLAAQYESLRDPLIILITVPLSICGALIPLALGWATLNIYTQIGLVTLIGLISKHGILMVEFANELQQASGCSPAHAIIRSARIRLRPILMTTAAMVVGLVPLLFASGAGASSRFGLGIVIVVGMVVGTLFTLFVLPSIYTLISTRHTAPMTHGVSLEKAPCGEPETL